jgi:hypothetical protein
MMPLTQGKILAPPRKASENPESVFCWARPGFRFSGMSQARSVSWWYMVEGLALCAEFSMP